MNKLLPVIFVLICFSFGLYAQENTGEKYITITPGTEYEASGLYKFFFGEHWRKIWTTPIRVPVLDLDKFGGGLTPLVKGGGLQTKSLRFKGKDGNIWKFRSIQKDPTKVLEEDLRSTVVADVLQDQISSSNPVGALVAAPLLKAVGVLQAEPYICYMPDDEKLGEFRSEFGGILGIIEIHPDDSPDTSFAGSEKVVGTYKLFHRLEEKRSEKVDSKDFLKARLMDIYLGDWDRHNDQWRWAKFEEGGNKLWRPIPRDRDQVFPKYDGLFPSLAEIWVLQLNHFDYDYPPARNISWSGRILDRRFLSELTKPEWDSVAAYVQSKLTDDVIVDAVKHLPAEDYPIAKDELESKLKSRRDKIPAMAKDFYNLINKYVDIYCSNKDDYAQVIRKNNDTTEVNIYKKDKDTGEPKDKPVYHKIFDNSITDEIRIYMEDGDDKAVITGEADYSPLVRVIGGKGKDEFVNNSIVHGHFLSITPFPVHENQTRFYDSGDKSVFTCDGGTVIDKTKIPEPKTDEDKYEPHYKDRYHELEINPVFNYTSDNGLELGAGPRLFVYNFRMNPYEMWMTLTGSYAIKSRSYNFQFQGLYNSIIKGAQVYLDVELTELFLTKYFGYGNETYYNEKFEHDDFYRLEQHLFKIHPTALFKLSNSISTSVGISYNRFNSEVDNQSLVLQSKYKDYGSGEFKLFGLHYNLKYDTRDNNDNARVGTLVHISADFFPSALSNKSNFLKGGFDIRQFFLMKTFTDFTLGLRCGGEKVWGKYPFFEAAFLGGKENIRGYSRERFAGDEALFAQTELRVLLGRTVIVLPAKYGIHSFVETGRVFTSDNDSDKWHPSYGGGIWLSFLDNVFTTSFSLAFSPETIQYYIRSRMGF